MSAVEQQERTSVDEVTRTVAWLASELGPIRELGVGRASAPALPGTGHGWERLVYDPLAAPADAGDTEPGLTVRAAAVSVYGGAEQLNVTQDPHRSSLLEPNRMLLARHAAAGFEIRERRTVPSVTLGALEREHGPFDVLRLRANGLEYPLISSSLETVRKAVCIEVEGGMVDNYVGQYPFAVVAPLLHGAGYSLLEMDCTARQQPAWGAAVRHQPLEYRGLWMRDDLLHGRSELSLTQGVTLLVLCRNLGHHPFGHEVAVSLYERSLIPPEVARTLLKADFWALPWNFDQ